MISLILLSGGLSSRFGSPKALALWGQRPLIVHLQDTLLAANIDEIIIVLGACDLEIKPFILKHEKIKVVHNKDYKFGQTSSFKAGVAAVSPDAAMIGLLPVDFPLIKGTTINRLIADVTVTLPLIVIPTYHGQKGHPPFFNSVLKNEILQLSDDVGLNMLAYEHANDIRFCAVDDQGILLSFNTKEEFESLRAKFI